MKRDRDPNRRRFLQQAGLVGPALLIAGCHRRGGGATVSDARSTPTPTPSPAPAAPAPAPPPPVDPGSKANAVCEATSDNIEGPFFKRNAPSRAVLARPTDPGTRLSVTGRVLDTSCRPIPGVAMEFWQADNKGNYDNKGFRFRGRLRADPSGVYRVETIIPGHYRLNPKQFRPAHIHVKLHAPGFQSLTTQLYFDGDPHSVGDPFIVRSLIMKLRAAKRGKQGAFDFVLQKR